jgi:hypothetical protein
MRAATLCVMGLLLAACRRDESGGALLALLQLEPSLPASCVTLEVVSSEGEVLQRRLLERPAGRNELRVAIFRGTLPEKPTLQARPLWGSACAEPLLPNGAWQKASGHFVRGETRSVTLTLPRPSAAEDGDQDGFVSDSQGGPDCDDGRTEMHPNAQERCDGSEDLNCDGRRGCDDATCESQVCLYPAVRLAFTTPPRTPLVRACSEPLVLERQAASGQPTLGQALHVELSASPQGTLGLFADAACTVPLVSLLIPEAEASARFFIRGTQIGSVQLTATSGALTAAQQTQTLSIGPPTTLAFSSLAQTLQAGACSQEVVVQTRDAAGNPSPVSEDTGFLLGASPAGVLVFFTDAACTSAISTLSLPAGSSEARFHFKGLSGGSVGLGVSGGGLGLTQQFQTVRPAVRSSSCTLAAGSSSVNCPLSPPLVDRQRSLLLFQASTADNTSASSFVRCRLADSETITCSRHGTAGVADIQWQVAELPHGLRVQHVTASCGASRTTVPIEPVRDLAETFLLYSSQQSGTTINGDDFPLVRLIAPETAEFLTSASSCVTGHQYALQVVEWEGARVTRETSGSMSGTSLEVTGLEPVDLSRTVLLFTMRSTATGSTMCDRLLRGELTSPTSLRFSRGHGASGCASQSIENIAWERIELPPGTLVQQLSLEVANGSTTTSATLSPAVDLTRTLAFSGNQSHGGQSLGESTYSQDDIPGVAAGRHLLTAPDRLEVHRGSSLGATRWTSYVLQLFP